MSNIVYKKGNDWLYPDPNEWSSFLMLPHNLLIDEAFCDLREARYYYIAIAEYAGTSEHLTLLRQVLKFYCDIGFLNLNEEDIKKETLEPKRQRYTHGYFVFPDKAARQYGFKPSNSCKLRKKLIDAGFIRLVAGGKGKYTGWNKNVSLYQFVTTWRKFPSVPQDTSTFLQETTCVPQENITAKI